MASSFSSSSSSSSPDFKRYHVFSSFHGPDVRSGFLSHLHNHFESKGITTFKDHEIERGHTIGPELIQAIRESRVSVVVLSEKYASSLDLSNSDIKMLPYCVIGLPHLLNLDVGNCRKLVSIQGHSPSLVSLLAKNCISLESVCCSFHRPISILNFYNCLKLDEESKKGIIQQSDYDSVLLPGKEIPAEFTHQTRGNSITISLAPGCEEAFSTSSRFKACLLLSPTKDFVFNRIRWFLRSKGVGINCTEVLKFSGSPCRSLSEDSEHLYMFCGDSFIEENRCLMDVTPNEILFEFSSSNAEIMGCGVKILAEEGQSSSGIEVSYSETGSNRNHHIDGEAEAFKVSQVENIKNSTKQTGHWSLLRKLRLEKKKMKMNKTELSSRPVSESSDDT